MGMAASQARYLAIIARKSNCEYEGQQINQARTVLSNQSANLFNQMLSLSVPIPPSTQDFTKTQYSFTDGVNSSVIESWQQISTADPDYNYVVTHHYYTDKYTGSQKKLNDPQVQFSSPTIATEQQIIAAANAIASAKAAYDQSVNDYTTQESIAAGQKEIEYAAAATAKVSEYTAAETAKLAEYAAAESARVSAYDTANSTFYNTATLNTILVNNAASADPYDYVSIGTDSATGNSIYQRLSSRYASNGLYTAITPNGNNYDLTGNNGLTYSYEPWSTAVLTSPPYTQASIDDANAFLNNIKQMDIDSEILERINNGDYSDVYFLTSGATPNQTIDAIAFKNDLDALVNGGSAAGFSVYTPNTVNALFTADTTTINNAETQRMTAISTADSDYTNAILTADSNYAGAISTADSNYSNAISPYETARNDAKAGYEQALADYEALGAPEFIGNCPLEYITTLSADQEAELRQIMQDMQAQGINDSITDCFDPVTGQYNGGIYTFEMNGQTYFTTYDDLYNSYTSGTGNNQIDGQNKLAYYNASYISTKVEKTEKALLETDGQGRFSSVKFESDSAKYVLKTEQITDDVAYEDAMNQYLYENAKYDKTIQDINAKTSIIQRQDQQLELRLKKLETEQKALSNEMDAVQKVLGENVDKSFKTFSS